MSEITVVQHMFRCQVRQLLRYGVERNAGAIEEMRGMPNYSAVKAEAERQWKLGNRGEEGKWFE